MKIEEVDVSVPEGHQLILGQAHFIKTVEDLYETLATSMPGIRFGVAFCEASGKSLVRSDGSDDGCVRVAVEVARRVGAGHVFCATASPVTVAVGDSGKGRGILGVIDGGYLKGEEGPDDREERRGLLRRIGYKR